MARTGRPKSKIPRRHVSTYLREDLLAQVELIIGDPLRDKAKYGARSDYFEMLIEKDLNERREAFRKAQRESQEVAGQADSGNAVQPSAGEDQAGKV